MKVLTDYSINHPVSIISAVIAMCVLGILAVNLITVDQYPSLPPRKILVSASYEGLSAEDVQSLITIPLEDALSSVKGIDGMSSTSREGVSLITIHLKWGYDPYETLMSAREVADGARVRLPSRCDNPIVTIDDGHATDVITLVVTPLDGDLASSRRLVEDAIVPVLRRVDSAGSIHIVGGQKEKIEIRAVPELLAGKKMVLEDIVRSYDLSSLEYPAGIIREGNRDIMVRTSSMARSVEDINTLPVVRADGSVFKMTDVAKAVTVVSDPKSLCFWNGKECIAIGINTKTGKSPVELSKDVRSTIPQLVRMYGSLMNIETVSDFSISLLASIWELCVSAVIGILAVIVVIYFFYGNLLRAILIASVVPVVLLSTIWILYISGRTVNTISLSGLAIGIGLVVDASVVVLDSIEIELAGTTITKEKIANGCNAVSVSNAGSAITSAIVFCPLFLLDGPIKAYFMDMALAILFSVIIALILSSSWVPALYTSVCRCCLHKDYTSKWYNPLLLFYERTLKASLAKPGIVIIVTVALIILGSILSLVLPREAAPSLSTKQILFSYRLPVGTTMQSRVTICQSLHKQLMQLNVISSVLMRTGLEDEDYWPLSDPAYQNESIEIMVQCNGVNQEKEVLMDKIRFLIDKNGEHTELIDAGNSFSDVLFAEYPHMVVYGSDQAESLDNAKLVNRTESSIIPSRTQQWWSFELDRDQVSRIGLTCGDIAGFIGDALNGCQVSSVQSHGYPVQTEISMVRSQEASLQDVLNVRFPTAEGVFVPVSSLASVTREIEETVLWRHNRRSARMISMNVSNEIESGLLPQSCVFNPVSESITSLAKQGLVLLILTLIVLYLIIAGQFESFGLPFLFFVSIPPAFAGSFIGLFFSGKTININSIISLVILFGISVNNSILLWEGCKQSEIKRRSDMITACKRRFSSILVTNGTTIAALLPFTFDPSNSNAQSSLAISLLCGLSISTIVTIYIVPVLLSWRVYPERTKND